MRFFLIKKPDMWMFEQSNQNHSCKESSYVRKESYSPSLVANTHPPTENLQYEPQA
jgi:hypothetical protein